MIHLFVIYILIRFAGMGNLLKVLTRDIENYPHFFLDFESKFERKCNLAACFVITEFPSTEEETAMAGYKMTRTDFVTISEIRLS